MSSLYCGKPVLRVEHGGQCEKCKRGVIRVLVQEGGWRKWYPADLGYLEYEPHECGSGGVKPLGRAA